MAEYCSLSPKIKVRRGSEIKEVDSKLFKRIKEAVKGDNDAAWKLWGFTKTPEFLREYKNKVDYDELGEPTFSSYIKAIGAEDIYNKEKSLSEVIKDYKFDSLTFDNPGTAMVQINNFNTKEKDYVATLKKEGDHYKVLVRERNGATMDAAYQQAYSHALTGELLDLLHKLGFDVSWATDPKYNGLFDPQNAQFINGLFTVISIVKGEKGEEALPEEVSHLLIEGMINHPLVQRLLGSLTQEHVQEILGDMYDEYVKEYDGNEEKLRKEAAGKLLGNYITRQGTIRKSTVQRHRSLLSRIWNFIKSTFQKITNNQLEELKNKAHDAVKDIYNVIASNEIVSLVDKHAVLSADYLYFLNESFDNAEKLARAGKNIVAVVRKMESAEGVSTVETTKLLAKIKDAVESDSYYDSLVLFLGDARKRMEGINEKIKALNDQIALLRTKKLTDIHTINLIAKLDLQINSFLSGYSTLLTTLATLDNTENYEQLKGGLSEVEANHIAQLAATLLTGLNRLTQWDAEIKRKIVYGMARSVVPSDKVRGIGSRRNEIMSLEQIIDHAERDINFIDNLFSAMSDADDALLVIIDGLVKNQKYERDLIAEEWRTKIAYLERDLRNAGFTSDFMYEREADDPRTPTGRIISIYDWEGYIKDRNDFMQKLQEKVKKGEITGAQYREELRRWKNGMVDGKPRLVRVYVDPEVDEYYKKYGKNETAKKYPSRSIYELMPNPEVYTANVHKIEELAPAQKKYYEEMIKIKRTMMTKIPHRGQAIYRAVYISKDFVEGVLSNSTGNIGQAILDNFAKQFVRRPDSIGFGVNDDFSDTIKNIIKANPDNALKAAKDIVNVLAESVDADIIAAVNPRALQRIINNNQNDLDAATSKIIEFIQSSDFYLVDVDFSGSRVQHLPVYYTRRLHNMRMLSTDFSATITSYMAMAVNYEKMNEVVAILEVARNYINTRKVMEVDGGKSLVSQFSALGESYRHFVTKAGSKSNIAERMDDFMASAVYEERKKKEGTIPGVNLDIAQTLDTIKNYTGLLALGFNIFSTFSNVTVGKVQQWIEAAGGEYFGLKDYDWAVGEYHKLLPGYLAEMGSNIKKNKLSLLIQMFDPMGDYYESLRNSDYNNSALSKIIGEGLFAYFGMNAGEHLLHCQTMLAMLHHIKLKDADGNEITLYDALEVKEVNGITQLVLKEGLSYERQVVDNTGTVQTNKNYGRPLRNKDGSYKTETVYLKDLHDNATQQYIIKIKRRIRKVNNSLNGAFSADDKGALQRRAVGRLILQFRQWMIAHYERRFARAHYDDDLEQWREGFYVTFGKQIIVPLFRDLVRAKTQFSKYGKLLSEHEKANLRRATTEMGILALLFSLVKIGGKVKDKSRSWLEKMALYQFNRMYLDVGASAPITPYFFSNIFTLLKSPMASVDTFENLLNIIKFWDMFDEVQTGRYEGWSVYEKNMYQLVPALDQIDKAVVFDDSMFSIFDK